MLDCSGGASVLTEATVAKSRTSDSYLKAAHIPRTKKAHEMKHLLYLFFKRKLKWIIWISISESAFWVMTERYGK